MNMVGMADHRDILASFSPELRARLTEKRDAPGFIRLGVHYGLIALVGCWIAIGGAFWPLLLLPQGVLIVFLFTLLHETTHETPFRSARVNQWIGRLSGAFIVLPYTWFKYFHLAHHRHTHDPERDPELADAKEDGLAGYLWRVTGVPVWVSHFGVLVRNALGRDPGAFAPASTHGRIVREARVLIAVYGALFAGSLYFGSDALLWAWMLPAILGQPFLRLYLMAEHGRCPHVANMLENTRTTFTTSLVRWVAWNMPYHAEHHALPAAPFHRLPELHDALRPHLRVTSNGYAAFHKEHVEAITRP